MFYDYVKQEEKISDRPPSVPFSELSGWSGTNNITAGGETREYDVSWDPSQLKGDLKTASTVDFRIYFVVTDPTT